MAYIAPTNEDKDKKSSMDILGDQNQDMSEEAASAPTLTTGSAPLPSTSSQPSQENKAIAPKGSGTYTNFQKYISANQPAISNLAGRLTEKATTEAQQIGQTLQNREQKLQENIESAAQRQQQDVGQATDYVKQLGQGQQRTDEGDALFQEIIGGQRDYTVNQNLATSDIQSQAQQIAQRYNPQDKLSSTKRMLANTFRGENPNNQYTAGERAFDAALLSGDPSQLGQVFQTGQQTAQQSLGDIESARRQALEALSGRRLEAGTVDETLYGAVEGEQGRVRQDVMDEVAAIQDKQQRFEQFLATGANADEFVTEQDVQEFMQQRQSLADKLERLGTQDLRGMQNWIGDAARRSANVEKLREQLAQQNIGQRPNTGDFVDRFEGLDTFVYNQALQEYDQNLAQEMEKLSAISDDEIRQQFVDQPGFRRDEWAPQILNELDTLTDQIGVEELRSMGMTREDLTNYIREQAFGGTGDDNAFVDAYRLEQAFKGLGGRARLTDEEAARQALLEQFAPQRTTQGDVTSVSPLDLSEVVQQAEASEATVADEQQRAIMDALIGLSGRGQQFTQRRSDQQQADIEEAITGFDASELAGRIVGTDVYSDEELQARKDALAAMSGDKWRWLL